MDVAPLPFIFGGFVADPPSACKDHETRDPSDRRATFVSAAARAVRSARTFGVVRLGRPGAALGGRMRAKAIQCRVSGRIGSALCRRRPSRCAS